MWVIKDATCSRKYSMIISYFIFRKEDSKTAEKASSEPAAKKVCCLSFVPVGIFKSHVSKTLMINVLHVKKTHIIYIHIPNQTLLRCLFSPALPFSVGDNIHL